MQWHSLRSRMGTHGQFQKPLSTSTRGSAGSISIHPCIIIIIIIITLWFLFLISRSHLEDQPRWVKYSTRVVWLFFTLQTVVW